MKKSELPLYLKNSSIYNKILQLAIAVICMVILFNMLTTSKYQQANVIKDYFSSISEQQIVQAVNGLKILIAKNNQQAIENYVETLSHSTNVEQVRYYDATGRLLASSENSQSMNEIFIASEQARQQRRDYKTFIEEIRTPELLGYLQLTVNQTLATKPLNNANSSLHETMRLVALFAVVIGFFLTRGFSRFSRQGFRIVK